MDRHFWSPTGAAPRTVHWAACLAALVVAGCGYQPPEFRLNTEGPERGAATKTQSAEIARWLAALFGTPDAPKAPDAAGLRGEPLRRAAGPVRSDEQGTDFGLYRKHCAACHGISGDGAGPAAVVLDPYPRDFRPGLFKFTSTAGGAKPVDDDLRRTIHRGLPGTAMPSFAALDDAEIDALVEYVKYLSLRGETELYLFQRVVVEDDYIADVREVIDDAIAPLAERWASAPARRVVPAARSDRSGNDAGSAASIVRGRALYQSDRAKCTTCHGPEGRGDGPQAGSLVDDWNKPKQANTPEASRRAAGQYRLPLQRLRPRDLTRGIFKGGSRDEDLYWRIHVGIKGTPMPGAGAAPGATGVLTPPEILDLVDYVRSLAVTSGRRAAASPRAVESGAAGHHGRAEP